MSHDFLGENATLDSLERGWAHYCSKRQGHTEIGPVEGIARVRAVDRGRVRILRLTTDAHDGESDFASIPAHIPGGIDAPAVGDWVRIGSDAHGHWLEEVLPRVSLFARRSVGKATHGQAVAANLDRVVVVTAVGEDFNLRRLERYIAVIHASGARPVVLVNKCDRDHDRDALAAELNSVAPDIEIHWTSALHDEGVSDWKSALAPGETVALVGSSGVGKSTLVNRLLGDRAQTTHETIERDDRGVHTTTRRELFVTEDGIIVIDTPGMKELGLWDAAEGIEAAFSDIESLAADCRFRDCQHELEPGCAVQAAVEGGSLAAGRLANWHKLRAEQASLRARADGSAARNAKKRWKSITKQMRHQTKLGRTRGQGEW